jgi:lysophospholipase
VEDLHDLLLATEAQLPTPRYLYAHSMGGAVAALYLAQHQGFFQKAVLSSPMIAMQYKGVPRFLGYAACAVLRLFGRGKKRFVGMSEAPLPEAECVERSEAQSAARFEAYRRLKLSEPRFRASRPCVKWVHEALRCTRSILKRGAPEGISIPVRIYAAEREALVLEAPQRAFAARLPRGEFRLVAGAKHEIYFAGDEILHPYMREVLEFFGND